MRSGEINLEEIIDAAETATLGKTENLEKLILFLKSEESAVRYWGATGLLMFGKNAAQAIEELKIAINDKSANVVAVAAEALYNLGEKEATRNALLSVIKNPNELARCYALNVIDCLDDKSPEIVEGVVCLLQDAETISRNKYDVRVAKRLIEKWGLNPEDYSIKFDW